MEAHQTQGITHNKQRSKTLGAGRGGGAVPGLLVFGGALAVTGLIAVASFVTKRNKARPPPHKPQQSDHTSPGIPSLQDSSTNHDIARRETSNTRKNQVFSCESIPGQTLILEDKPDLQVKNYVEEESPPALHQEIVLSDDYPPESTVSFNDNGIGEEGLESSADSPCFKVVDHSEPREPLKPVEINEGQLDSDSAPTETEDDILEEDDDAAFGTSENSSEGVESSADSPCTKEVDLIEPQEPLKSVEINEGQRDSDSATTKTEDDIVEEDDDAAAFGTSENSSEVTGRTSLDSSEGAIWPAELIEEEPQQVKGKMVNDQNQAEGTAKSNISSHSGANISESPGYAGGDRVMVSPKANSSEKPNLYVALNYYLSASKFKTWVIFMLLFAILLLVLLTHRKRISGSLTVSIL